MVEIVNHTECGAGLWNPLTRSLHLLWLSAEADEYRVKLVLQAVRNFVQDRSEIVAVEVDFAALDQNIPAHTQELIEAFVLELNEQGVDNCLVVPPLEGTLQQHQIFTEGALERYFFFGRLVHVPDAGKADQYINLLGLRKGH